MIDSITSFSRNCCEDRIKFLKKTVRGNMAWTMFMLAITAYDCYDLYQRPSTFTGFALGSMVITSIWTIMFLFEFLGDLKGEKLRHLYLTELHDKQLASGEREEYLSAKKHYEEALQNLNQPIKE